MGYTFLDPLAGLVVSELIMKTAWDMGKQSVDELTDAVTDPEIGSHVYQLMNNVEGVQDFHEVKVRRMGSYLLVGSSYRSGWASQCFFCASNCRKSTTSHYVIFTNCH